MFSTRWRLFAAAIRSRAPQCNHGFNIACRAAKVSGQSIKKFTLLFIGRKFTDEGAILGVREQLFEPCL
jgi:hypothetical protein